MQLYPPLVVPKTISQDLSPTAPTMLVSEIPEDIYLAVFKAIFDDVGDALEVLNYDPSKPVEFPASHRKLATQLPYVSHQFYRLTMPLIYRRVVVRTARHLEVLHGVVANGSQAIVPFSPEDCIKRLDFQISEPYESNVVHLLISLLPKLEILVFDNLPWDGITRYPPFPDAVIEGLVLYGERVKRLEFRSQQEVPTYSHIAQIATRCTGLQSLHLGTVDLDEDHLSHTSPPPTRLSFHSTLKRLSLGPGPYSLDTLNGVDDRATKKFDMMIRRFGLTPPFLPGVECVDLLNEVLWKRPFVVQMGRRIDTMVCVSGWKYQSFGGKWERTADDWLNFANLRHLVLVLQRLADPLPEGLPTVEVVELVQPPAVQWDRYAGMQTKAATEQVLDGLTTAGYPRLKHVMVEYGKGQGTEELWLDRFGQCFRAVGVDFSLRRVAIS